MGLPGIPGVQSTLGTSMTMATLTLTLFLAGFSLGPVMFGPLSDRYGRKPILLIGVALFAVTAIGCAFANSIEILLGLRTVQGIGAGAAAALPAAIVRDTFQGNQALNKQSYVAMVNGLAPLVAPLIGAVILCFWSWRAIYVTLAIVGVLLFFFVAMGFAESAPADQQENQRKHALFVAMTSYQKILTNRQYLIATGLLGATFGMMFSYISSSSAVFMGLLGASSTTYALLFAFTAIGEISGAACTGRFAASIGARRLLAVAVLGGMIVSLCLLAIALAGAKSIGLCALIVVFSNFFSGIVMPNATHMALKDLGTVAGSAAALQRSIQMIMGATASAIVGGIGGNPLEAMAITMVCFAFFSLVLLLANFKYCQNSSDQKII